MTGVATAVVGTTDAERDEFEKLFLRSKRGAYNLAYRLVGNAGEAEDLAQDAFVRAWRGFEQYDRSRPFEAWLGRIVTNLAIDRRRRSRLVRMHSLDAPLIVDSEQNPLSFSLTDRSCDPEELLLAQQIDEPIQRALDALPRNYREAVMMADVQERSHEEVATQLHCTLGTLRSRLHRARRMMRGTLEASASRDHRPARLAHRAVRRGSTPHIS